MPYSITLSEFSAAEAEAITGLAVMEQRNWRRRGYLPPLPDSRHARFGVTDLAEMQIRAALAFRGIGPARSEAIGPSCALRITAHALGWSNAWTGNPWDAPGETWGCKAEWLTAGAVGVRKNRFFVWTEETHLFTDNVAACFDGTVDLPRLRPGPVVVLDLEAMGGDLLDRAGRPLARVELPA